MGRTMPNANSAPAPAKPPGGMAEWILAAGLLAAVVALHGFFWSHAGGLFRDEVNSFNLAHGAWSNMAHDLFPVLFPFLLRVWVGLGLGGTDLALRGFGVLMGLTLTAAFWLAAWWLRRRPPVWSLVLVALNAWVIYYDAWLRAYGLGSAIIALCAGAGWLFLEKPGRKNWLLVAAICAGACAVCARRKKFKLAAGIFLGGLTAAISLTP